MARDATTSAPTDFVEAKTGTAEPASIDIASTPADTERSRLSRPAWREWFRVQPLRNRIAVGVIAFCGVVLPVGGFALWKLTDKPIDLSPPSGPVESAAPIRPGSSVSVKATWYSLVQSSLGQVASDFATMPSGGMCGAMSYDVPQLVSFPGPPTGTDHLTAWTLALRFAKDGVGACTQAVEVMDGADLIGNPAGRWLQDGADFSSDIGLLRDEMSS